MALTDKLGQEKTGLKPSDFEKYGFVFNPTLSTQFLVFEKTEPKHNQRLALAYVPEASEMLMTLFWLDGPGERMDGKVGVLVYNPNELKFVYERFTVFRAFE